MRKLFLKDQLRCGQFTPAECGQINWRMQAHEILRIKIRIKLR